MAYLRMEKKTASLPNMSRIFLIAALLCVTAQEAPAATSRATPAARRPTRTTASQSTPAATNQSMADPPAPSGREIIARMYGRYAGHWYRTFTFDQTTQQYRNETLKKTQTWYEFIRFPDRFRMDFGDADSGNAAIFRGDSCYRFHDFKLASATINNNEGLIFLLGGMFFYPLDQVYKRLDDLHYDLTAGRLGHWQGRTTFIIGKSGANQLWIDSERLCLVRMLKVDGAQTLDARFDDYKPFEGGWGATKCSFYFNGKLVQVETYHHCKAEVPLGESLFDPAQLVRSH